MEATSVLPIYCFQVVRNRLRNLPPPPPPPSIEAAGESMPLFVCFKKTRNDELRGCIGTFSFHPLAEQLKKYAISAAFEDSRFTPLATEQELKQLKCTVSLLRSFEKVKRWDDWIVGTHGVQIDFEVPPGSSNMYSATYLPHVAQEQGWNARETMESLVRKSGYRGAVDSALLERLAVTRYQESASTASYEDAFPNDVDEQKSASSKHSGCAAV